MSSFDFMASSVVRSIPPIWCCINSADTHTFRSASSLSLRNKSKAAAAISCSAKPPPSRASPWLMLPPAFEGGDMLYNFYIPAEDITLPINKRKGFVGGEGDLPPNDAKFVGSSHGWLALFDENSNRVFLSNPLSGQTIKLPAIDALPDPDVNLLAGRGQVSRVVLSSSPLEDGCRALMNFGPQDRLAFCSPRAAAAEWRPIGDLRYEDYEYTPEWISDGDDSDGDEGERNYEDFVYSKRHDLFFCITERNTEVEAWDLRDPLSPRIHWKLPHGEDLRFAYPVYYWPGRTKKEWSLIDKCFHPKYLIFSDSSDHLFVVVRHVIPRLRPDGSAAPRIYFFGYTNPWDTRYPYKTVEFDVFKINRESGELSHMEGSLDGLAMFVGTNHSFAVPASEYPGLKPDSIYFTDEDRRITPEWLSRTSFGGHDNGVYDYRGKSVSPCCGFYPVEYDKIRRVVPPPVWFTPTE